MDIDFEILEWVCINKLYIDTHNECDYHIIHTAIENLIQEYKVLKEKNKKLQIRNEIEKEKNKELEVINKMQEYRIGVIDEREMIPKSKLKEKIEELEKLQENNRKDMQQALNFLNFNQLDKLSVAIFINMTARDILNQLLEEGE